jgi:hypothetical protein
VILLVMVILDFETLAVTGEAAAFRDVASEFANWVAVFCAPL